MARNVLNGVISYYRRNPCNIAHEIIKRLKSDAAKAFEAVEKGDWHVFTAVMKLCGAGGGGFMLIIACNRSAKRRIRQILETGSPIRGGKFYDFGLSLS